MLIFIYILFICGNASSSSLSFADVEFAEGHPGKYTLFRVNPKQVFGKSDSSPSGFASVAVYISSRLLENEHVHFSSGDTFPSDDKNMWVHKHDLESNRTLLRLFQRSKLSPTETFMDSLHPLTGFHSQFTFDASMIILPGNEENHTMIYVFGLWRKLLNPLVIVPSWGLHLAASQNFSQPSKVKEIRAKHHKKGAPRAWQEKGAVLGPLHEFAMEVGSETLGSIRILPQSFYGTRLIKGDDYLRFSIDPMEDAPASSTLESLTVIAHHFGNFSIRIHPEFLPFIDQRVSSPQILITSLNRELELLWKKTNAEELSSFLFIRMEAWAELGTQKAWFGTGKKRTLWSAVDWKKAQVTTQVEVRSTRKQKQPLHVALGALVCSQPVEHKGNFYRFEGGHWFRVDDSRFGAIRRLMRRFKVPAEELGLPPYTYDDAKGTDGPGVHYAESNYNTRAVRLLNTKSTTALLLDRLNVPLSAKGGEQFEFADMLIKRRNHLYIVHVKRQDARAFSHHCDQVERSVDFLSSELNRKRAHMLFVQSLINDLYAKYGVTPPQKGAKRWFVVPKETVPLKEGILRGANGSSVIGRLKRVVLGYSRIDFFTPRPDVLCYALDAFYRCVRNTPSCNTRENVYHFLSDIRSFVGYSEALFSRKPIYRQARKKIHMVLAVVDDRQVASDKKYVKATEKAIEAGDMDADSQDAMEKELAARRLDIEANKRLRREKKDYPPIKPQDLWRLDRTRLFTQNRGFGFIFTMVNEYVDEDWDAFGSTVEDDTLPTSDDDALPTSRDASPGSGEEEEKEEQDFSSAQSVSDFAVSLPTYKGRDLSTDSLLRLEVRSHSAAVDGLYDTYVLCPTVGDGDCFFHAAFTKAGETKQAVSAKAARMRTDLCDAVGRGEYVEESRRLLYEHYLTIHAQNPGDSSLPTPIRERLNHNALREKVKSTLTSLGVGDLPGSLSHVYTQEDILSQVAGDRAKAYMEYLRVVGDERSYVRMHTGDLKATAAILAERNNIRLNIFTFDKRHRALRFVKSCGTGSACPINILLHGSHYVRLYNPAEPPVYGKDALQIIRNRGT